MGRKGTLLGAVYIDADELPGAIRPSGAYRTRGQKLTATVVLVRDLQKLKQLRVDGSTQDLDTLAARIAEEIDRAVALLKH